MLELPGGQGHMWAAAATNMGTWVCKNCPVCTGTRVQEVLVGTDTCGQELPGGPRHTRVRELPRVHGPISPSPGPAGPSWCWYRWVLMPEKGREVGTGGNQCCWCRSWGGARLGWGLPGNRIGPELPVQGAVPMDARGVGRCRC